ncbi:hypothetical protein ACH4YO_36110 [Streptomyces noursei]|uniref:hypothetical protein n=1 Tax=Streptomyces noursei TaxID=1971 RepID=UPI0033F22CEA
MAYAALGRIEEAAYPVFDELIGAFPTVSPDNAAYFGKKVAANRDELLPGLTDADLIATVQGYLGELLLRRLSATLRRGLPDLGQQHGAAPRCGLRRRVGRHPPHLVRGHAVHTPDCHGRGSPRSTHHLIHDVS